MTQVTWYKKFKFIIEIDNIVSSAFSKCSGLNFDIAKVEHKQGGVLAPIKAPGGVTYEDIVLTRGLCQDKDLWRWFKDTYNAAKGTGLDEPELKRSFDIVQLNRAGEEEERWHVKGAWCCNYATEDWDNDADEIQLETVTLCCDSCERQDD